MKNFYSWICSGFKKNDHQSVKFSELSEKQKTKKLEKEARKFSRDFRDVMKELAHE